MSLKAFDWYSWLVVSVGLLLGAFVVASLCFPSGLGVSPGGTLSFMGVFKFDGVSFYLVLLSGLLWLSLWFFVGFMSVPAKVLISFSVVSSLLSYCCSHALVFWVFYELSILPLLLLLILGSPYSERFMATWYLLGYVVLTSLPMLLCLFYLALDLGSLSLSRWAVEACSSYSVLVLLGVLFVTKIPLPPFHVWLPMVHAEASSPVSVCLSGYMMKLGVLGACRFCFWVLPEYLFNSAYMLLILVMGVVFFLSAVRELDGKRWLAFLSLSHMLIAAVCLSVSGPSASDISLLFCLGHGLSAGCMFMLLWVIYEVSGTRNWAILKSSLAGSLLFRLMGVSCLCTAGSLPPTVNFFCEVFVIIESGFYSTLFFFVFFLYIFISGLVPLFLMGTLLTRHTSVWFGSGHVYGFMGSILLLGVWGFMLFVVC